MAVRTTANIRMEEDTANIRMKSWYPVPLEQLTWVHVWVRLLLSSRNKLKVCSHLSTYLVGPPNRWSTPFIL